MSINYSLKPLGENSWLLLADGDRLGLVNELEGKINVIGKITPKTYESIAELSHHLGGKITIEEMTVTVKEPIAADIGGYPTKHITHTNVTLEPFPTYTKTEKSATRYAAGYWALKFQNGWTATLCPRLSTLAEYDNIGPYTTNLEIKHQMSQKNKEIKL